MSLNRSQSKSQPRGVTSTTRSLLRWSTIGVGKSGLERDDIPDVVQEVFKAVTEHIGKFRKERTEDTFRGWLRVITRNKAMDFHRRMGKEARGEGGTVALQRLEAIPDHTNDNEGEQVDNEAHSILFRQALALIRADFRKPTWMAFWKVVVDGRLPVDVADELNMSPGAVRVAKYRVLQRLRQELGDLAVDR